MGQVRPDKGVLRRKDSAVWQHRVFVPKDVRAHYGDRQVLPAKSLGTKDLAEANRLARLRAAEYEKEFEAHRKGAPTTKAPPQSALPTLTPAAIERLAAQHRTWVSDHDFEVRAAAYRAATADPEAFWRGEVVPLSEQWMKRHRGWSYWDTLCEDEARSLDFGVDFCLTAQRKHRLGVLQQALRAGRTDVVEEKVGELLRGFAPNDAGRLKFLRRLMEVEIEVLAGFLKDELPNFPALQAEAPSAADGENPLLSEAMVPWLAQKQAMSGDQRHVEDCLAAASLLAETAGDKPMAVYTKGDVRRLKDILRALPANRNKLKETRGLGVQEVVRVAEKAGLPPMSVTNANKYLGNLYNLFEFAVGSYDGVNRNVFQNASIPARSTPRDEWDPFSEEALQKFFDAPLYRGCKSAKQWFEPGDEIPRDSARFWVPLLLLYSGARVNEICKLATKDIGCTDGIHYLSIEWTADDDEKRIAGRVKNPSSVRKVPLHDDLVAVGFLEFVERRRHAGDERLFVELRPDRYGKLYGDISKRFSDTFLHRLGIKTKKTSLKSFRHNFVDAARNSRIPDHVIQALKGDAAGGTLSRYGHGRTDLEILAAEMAKLHFKEVKLEHLVLEG
jgi:integrase